MDRYGNEWAGTGATLSDKTARTEYGLTQDEIYAAIDAGTLQYRPAAPSACTHYGSVLLASRMIDGVRAAMAALTGSRPGRAVMIRTMASSSPALSRANAAGAGAAGP
jgi:hypothetical protein